jgi:Tfp pilus assembly protein PilF
MNTAIALDPNNPTLYQDRAHLYQAMGLNYKDLAEADFRKALELSAATDPVPQP